MRHHHELVGLAGCEGFGDKGFQGVRLVHGERFDAEARAGRVLKVKAGLLAVGVVGFYFKAQALDCQELADGRALLYKAGRLVHGRRYYGALIPLAFNLDLDALCDVVAEGLAGQDARLGTDALGQMGFVAFVLARNGDPDREQRRFDLVPVRDEVADKGEAGGQSLLNHLWADVDVVYFRHAGDGADVKFVLMGSPEGVGFLRAGQGGAREPDDDVVQGVFKI